MRIGWGCDCGGPVKRDASDPRARIYETIKDGIEHIVGFRPDSCPWRAYYDPLVQEVLEHFWAEEHGNLATVLGDDPPGILVDAIGLFKRALASVHAEDARIRREEFERQRAARAAANTRR